MSDQTTIEWTDATFNPWWGCTRVSPGCDHCYAEGVAKRYSPEVVLWDTAARRTFGDKHWQQPVAWNARATKAGKRMRVFCASMADVFDKDAPPGARERLWDLIEATPMLDWQILTKRVGNVARMVPPEWTRDGLPAHAWLGISVVSQEEADRDIPKLLALRARVRFLSCEPLLAPTRLHPTWLHSAGIDWVIVGGESGPNARPMHPAWVRDLRDQCAAANVPFLFKQWGEWREAQSGDRFDTSYGRGARPQGFPVAFIVCKASGTANCFHGDYLAPDSRAMLLVGKKVAGRTLDGRTHDEYPT